LQVKPKVELNNLCRVNWAGVTHKITVEATSSLAQIEIELGRFCESYNHM